MDLMDPWPLPPDIPWPHFLRQLRRPDPPKGWLEAAAALPDLRRRPLLLRWIAQHRKAPAHLRAALLARLPWRALAAIAMDASAHPQAAATSVERLQSLWPALSLGERRAFALMAPRPLWPLVWKVRDAGVLSAFLRHPRLGVEQVQGLLQMPLTSAQASALQDCRWREVPDLAARVLEVMGETLDLPEHGLVLGMAAPWVKVLDLERRIEVAARLRHPALRRLVRGPVEDPRLSGWE